jgi:hypothetical protein
LTQILGKLSAYRDIAARAATQEDGESGDEDE